MATFEELPYELIEALRSKNLLPFLELPETSCNQLAIVVYENQKFRPIIGEWGGISGIHLIPGVDRRPFTNESGDRQLTYVIALYIIQTDCYFFMCNVCL